MVSPKGMPVGAKISHANERFSFEIFSRSQAEANHGGQSLFRLAERGGLTWDEAAAICEARPYKKMAMDEAEAIVREHAARGPVKL